MCEWGLNKFSFVVDLEASVAQLCGAAETLMKKYPNDVDINLPGELRNFHAYVKQNYPGKEQIYHKDPYQIIFQDKSHLVFPYVEAILWQFLCLIGNKLFRRKVIFTAKENQKWTESNHVSRKTVCTEHHVHRKR